MNKRNVFIIIWIITISGIWAQDATEIIRKADQRMQGESSKSEMTMTIVRPEWSREIHMKAWTLGNEYSLVLITAPARDKGVAFLKRDQEIWNWQPSIDRVIKLPPSMMMQSWMGSDFTNDDLVKESSIVEDYRHKLVGDTVINERKTYKLELTPKENAPVVWGTILAYISKENHLHLLSKYYDEDGFLINTLQFSNIRKMDDRIIPSKLEMIPAENPNQKTVIKYNDIEFDIDIDRSFFSVQNMKRVR